MKLERSNQLLTNQGKQNSFRCATHNSGEADGAEQGLAIEFPLLDFSMLSFQRLGLLWVVSSMYLCLCVPTSRPPLKLSFLSVVWLSLSV